MRFIYSLGKKRISEQTIKVFAGFYIGGIPYSFRYNKPFFASHILQQN